MLSREALSKILHTARLNKKKAQLTIEQVSQLTIEDGYAIQKEIASKSKIVGWKIGATSSVIQKRLNLTQPFYGPIFDFAKVESSPDKGTASRFSIQHDLVRGIEAEFAFIIKKDIIPRPEKQYSVEELMKDYCSYLVPCIEICASRVPTPVASLTPLLIADGAGNGYVLFPSMTPQYLKQAADVYELLPTATSCVSIDGKIVAEGNGGNVLGSPSLALEWFVKEAVNGSPKLVIEKGTFVTTGATCGLIPLTNSCYVNVKYPEISNITFDIAFRS